MIALVVVPVAVGLLLLLFSEPLARHLRPSLAVRLLTALSLSVALCTGLALSAAAVLVCVRIGPLPRLGRWSAAAIQARSQDPEPFGLAATLVVAACLAAALVCAGRSLRDLHLAGRAVGLAVEQLEHLVGGHVRLGPSGPAGQRVREGPACGTALQGVLGVQPGQRGHHRGVRQVVVELGLHLGGGQRPARGGEAGEHLLLERTPRPRALSSHMRFLPPALYYRRNRSASTSGRGEVWGDSWRFLDDSYFRGP
jgi:hypothetical protein